MLIFPFFSGYKMSQNPGIDMILDSGSLSFVRVSAGGSRLNWYRHFHMITSVHLSDIPSASKTMK